MNLEFFSHQAIFDQAVQHLFQQRQAALLPRGGGAYRGYCGGCPVGSFIKPRLPIGDGRRPHPLSQPANK